MRSPRLVAPILLAACAIAVALGGCSSSPKGGKPKRTVLSTQYDDARAGAEASKAVAAQVGLLNDPALDAYITEIGRKLLRGAPRQSAFGYQFSVVDQFEPNAFALPGGYIFISRGLLALANNEDELACVIGHEITHAARRHAAARQAMEQRQNPLSMGMMRHASMASYGRDMEREADRGGQILAAAAGYDPIGMSTFLHDMGKLERLTIGHQRMPSFFDSHPGAEERATVNAQRASEIRWRRDPALGDTRVGYLRRIDGMALEQRPEAGVFVGDSFVHPDLDFTIRFPHGWSMANQATAVGASAPRGEAVIFLTADQPAGDPRTMAEEYVVKTTQEQNVEVEESTSVKIGSIDAWRVRLKAPGRGGSVAVMLVFIPYQEATWRLTGMTSSGAAKRYQGRFSSTARSFRPLRAEERAGIRTARLRIVTAQPGEDVKTLSRRTGNAWDASRTAVYNGIFANHRFKGGELVKVAHVEPYTAKPPAR